MSCKRISKKKLYMIGIAWAKAARKHLEKLCEDMGLDYNKILRDDYKAQ
jgi:hypothetical protein